MRSLYDLETEVPVHEWTDEESYRYCRDVFDRAVRQFPDLMEPYIIALGELAAPSWDAERKIMRQGLRTTFSRRFPL